MRNPPNIPKQVIAQIALQYRREVTRRRQRSAIIPVCQAEGSPQLVGDEMEAHIDELSDLLGAGHQNQEGVLQLVDEIEPLPEADQQYLNQMEGRHSKGDKISFTHGVPE